MAPAVTKGIDEMQRYTRPYCAVKFRGAFLSLTPRRLAKPSGLGKILDGIR